ELIGSIPDDLPRYFPSIELPQFKKRIGTSYVISPKLLDGDPNRGDEVSKIEIQLELQRQMTMVAYKLVQESSNCKTLKKKRKLNYQKEQAKLKDLETKFSEMRIEKRRQSKAVSSRSSISMEEHYSRVILAPPGI
ncbi:hypothetical protein HELRODRAFT_184603, partial [Helobdella robusta]|uniref:Uncharacterized protein n=1 Tax=Helobdella robusta TaxID=6412 RepID=T1FLK3_HELRO